MTILLGLKLALVPLIIGGVTLAGRRWGPGVAGWLSAFPVVSAPVLFFIAIEQGAPFAASATVATLSAVLAILLFGIAYAWAATRYGWKISALISFAIYFLMVAVLNAWGPTLSVAALTVAGALIIAPYAYPKTAPPSTDSASAGAAPAPRKDIWWRMAAGAVLVFLVTHFSSELGPRLSGLLAMFPVMASVLAVFSHDVSGSDFTIRLMRGMVLGYYAFSCFCLALVFALPIMSIGMAFLLALTVAVLVQGLTRIYLMRLR
ncbi:hypothetical protein BH11PSE11_BH11PSE11_19170 [soil metagenome]